ncbi:MAG: AAA family ATPase [Rhodobacter sp.]|uniref:AAA family ATPase n=1 Tax=Pararhodobacter sp. TaxID=2127056 RepID=UPI001D1FB4BE|nr:AAA family ATPase [Pararhodobacter sp.]MCB1344575.1 AAA family ATPase [Paracoccaceae bacterium]MCB1408231.1 AAA family ATPase [Paracoccaceae bacterium]MCC0071916.1 AAA family ATPase [Rhodobacter sp.]HPD91039.1 AAA family ATPase [Pararhodobacter sp.]
MSSAAATKHNAPIRACTVSRDVQNFDLLIEDMELELGESWGDLTFPSALKFLDQPDAKSLEFLAIALDDEDETNLAMVEAVIQRATTLGVRILLIAEELGPIALHRLLRLGASDFVPYPLPEGALHDAIQRLRQPVADVMAMPGNAGSRKMAAPNQTSGTVYAVQSLAGGSGATTFAVNLAWEIANSGKAAPRVCMLDFDLQTGSIATYLDLARTEKVYELLSNTAVMDRDFFMNTLQTFNDKLKVLTAAADMLPLDMISPDDIERVIAMARANFDIVVIDMPGTVVQWTETVLNEADVYFATMELDMRSAQNALRLIRALKAEDLPLSKLRYVLNRAPKFTDLSGKARAKRLAESLDIEFEVMLPDGTTQVTHANDHGLPLAEIAPKSPLLKEIRKVAQSIVEANRDENRAAA